MEEQLRDTAAQEEQSVEESASGVGEAPPPVAPAMSSTFTPDVSEYQRQLDWYRSQYQAALDQAKKLQDELDSAQLEGLPEDQRTAYLLEKEREELEQKKQELQAMAYALELRQYYSRFVPEHAIQGSTPAEWQESVLTYLTKENARLRSEVEKRTQPPRPGTAAPRIASAKPAGAPSKKTVFDYNPAELDTILSQVLMGQEVDYPPVE